jgi:hypothetical protein
VAILDLAHEGLHYAAEYDGAEWHGSPEQQAHDRVRRAEAAEAGWTIDAFVNADVRGQHRTVDARLRAGVIAAREAHGRRVFL